MFVLEEIKNAIQNNESDILDHYLETLNNDKLIHFFYSVDDTWPPIILSALYGSSDCMKVLLNYLHKTTRLMEEKQGLFETLCVNQINSLGGTALGYAVEKNCYLCTKLLLEAGANPNILTNDYNGSPLHIACSRNNLDILKLLIQFGGKLDLRTERSGNTPLSEAVFENSFQCAEYLISLGANVMDRSLDGYTPLHYAQLSEAGNHLECTKLLLEHGADVNAKTSDDETPLHLAAENCNDKAIEYLIAHGAEIDVQTDNFRHTPLHLAIRTIDKSYDDDEYDHACDAVKVLLEHHPRLDIKNCDNETPLEYALSESGFPIIRLLIDYGADVKTMLDYYINQSGRTSTLSDFLSEYKAERHYYPDKYRNDLYDLLYDYLNEEERIPFEAVKRANREPENAS